MKRKWITFVFVGMIAIVGISFIGTVSAVSFDNDLVSGQTATNAVARPDASTTLVISQAYGGGGGSTGTYSYDYVELKNISNAPQALGGLSLMYGSATGQFGSLPTNIYALSNATIQPGKYYLIQLSSAGTSGAPLPVAPDETTTNLNMSSTNGKVALVTSGFMANTCGATATPCTLPNPNIIDLVAWGTANNSEGGAATYAGASLTSTQGNVRKNGGCTDNDNNNLDFDIIMAPVPRNSATAAAPCAGAIIRHANVDFNGDGKSDYVVTRASGNANLKVWYTATNGTSMTSATQWGLGADKEVPADFDGDGKSDIAVWRDSSGGSDPNRAYFYVLQSLDATVKTAQFGKDGDTPKIVGDYDGDGKADFAVFRSSGTAADPCGVGKSVFYYRPSASEPLENYVAKCWGQPGDTPTGGDFDGDGKFDFCVRRNISGAGVFLLKRSLDGGEEQIYWGLPTDTIIPGDYDGDGRNDFCVARVNGTNAEIYIQMRSGGGTGNSPIVFGNFTSTTKAAPGDYDGDGKQDVALYYPANPPALSYFIVRRSSDGVFQYFPWGTLGDNPSAGWTVGGGQ